jgi:molecular chaperone DnaJ
VPVTFAELALGAEIKVPTHRGMPVNFRIPPGTPNGRTFRIPGKGVRRSDSTMGDLLVTVNVQVPKSLDSQARETLEAFRKLTGGEDPRADLLRQAKAG